jgi:hypothetical protein
MSWLFYKSLVKPISSKSSIFRRRWSNYSFYKDGTTVGSIGAISSDLEIHSSTSGHVGLRLQMAVYSPQTTQEQ